jgi:hypothetical protein
MFLAFKEMARAKVRFALLVAAIALLVFLILFQQSLQNGLITGFIGAIREQSAPVLVYSVDGQRVIQGSVITPDRWRSRSAPLRAPATSGCIGQGTFTAGRAATADGEDVRHDDHRLRARPGRQRHRGADRCGRGAACRPCRRRGDRERRRRAPRLRRGRHRHPAARRQDDRDRRPGCERPAQCRPHVVHLVRHLRRCRRQRQSRRRHPAAERARRDSS